MPSTSRRGFLQSTAAAAAAATTVLAPSAWAQSPWPSKPIRIIVPYTAGGFTDQMARLLQVGLQKALGQPVIVENKPGANSIIGVDQIAKAAPDGHTFGVVIAAYAANTTLYPKLPYNPKKDLVGVSLMGVSPLVAAVAMNAPFKTTPELIAYAKANPGKVGFGSSGSGSSAHLTTELMKLLTRTDMVHVPYKGAAPAAVDLLGGRISMAFDSIVVWTEHIKTGKVRALGVSSAQRSAALPNVPTIAEAGLPGFDVANWLGVLAPAKTPAAIVAKLNAELRAAMTDPDMRQQMLAVGVDPAAGTPQEFGDIIRKDIAKWAAVVKATGARLD